MTALLTADEAARLVPGERLVIVRPGDPQRNAFDLNFITFVAPQAWVALTGPCPTCRGNGLKRIRSDSMVQVDPTHLVPASYVTPREMECPDCQDGRRVVPLYTECPNVECGDIRTRGVCFICGREGHGPRGRVLVGRGSIEVDPVVREHNGASRIMVYDDGRKPTLFLVTSAGQSTFMELDCEPVPGRDFGIIIDCVEAV